MSGLLARLAPLATTGVGSLPFASPEQAVQHVLAAYELPFCPQLPRLYGDMIEEWLGADPRRCGWSPDRDRQLPGAWDAFCRALERRPPEHGVVKLQVTGPVTLATALERSGGRVGASRASMELAGEIATWVGAAIAGQVAAVRRRGCEVLLIIDEPGLGRSGLTAATTKVWDPLRAVGAAWGLHVCGAVPWEVIDAAEPDVISFDVRRHPPDEDAAAVALARLTARGGRVMWGAVDPVAPAGPADAVGRVSAAAASLARGGPLSEAIAASLISPSCGTGRLSEDGERRVVAIVSAAADAVRAAVPSLGSASQHCSPAVPPLRLAGG